ncbi:hypothetical protein YUWDRAFT_04534 [Streptomyces sp. AmelKG-D3]|nr:hypothetical protein YUWDRAFT_04534 [Streptomyces sp. AmelKG-D3]
MGAAAGGSGAREARGGAGVLPEAAAGQQDAAPERRSDAVTPSPRPVARIVRTALEALPRDGPTGRHAARLRACAAPEYSWVSTTAPRRRTASGAPWTCAAPGRRCAPTGPVRVEPAHTGTAEGAPAPPVARPEAAGANAGSLCAADTGGDRGVEPPVGGGRRSPSAAGPHAPAGPTRAAAGARRLPKAGRYGAVTVRSPRRGEAKASRSARVRPVSRATSAVSSAPQSMPRSR